MARVEFAAEVRDRAGVAVVDLHGDIDGSAEAALDAAWARATASDPSVVLLNFADVAYINSTGIALVVGVLARARKSRKAILAWGLSEHYREIFEITRVADFMSIFPDEESALAAAPA